MVAAMTAFLWLSIAALSSAELAAAGNRSINVQCVVGLLVQQAVQLQRQSDQLQRLSDQLQRQSGQLQHLQKRQKSLETSQENSTAQLKARQAKSTSFRAELPKEDVRSNTPIRFHQEFATGGRMYDQNTGIYTVDAPGVYLFTFQLFPHFPDDSLIDLYINHAIRIRSRCYSNSNALFMPCGSSSFFHLQKGDKVWVQSNKARRYWVTIHSFFSGALIFPDA